VVSPKPFLHRLGIKPKRKRKLSDQFPEEVEVVGDKEYVPEENSDIMAVQTMDLLFADEKTAIETLSSNFNRLANSMERLETSPVFKKGRLNRVGELGGGSGVLGMWLAFKNLCETCEIFDHAKNPLAIGEKWAAKLSLKSINFRHVSYAELASGASRNFDFVFAEHAVDLGQFSMNPDLTDVVASECDTLFSQRCKELAGAFNRLLLPNGVGLIGGGVPTPASLSLLCAALREQQLAIDWKLSSNEQGFLLYVRPGGYIVIDSPEDEALAILADSLPKRKTSPTEARSLETMFHRGKKYVEVCSEAEGVKYKCSIFQCAGLACLFQRNSKGYEGATVFSAGKMHVWADDVLRDASKRSITSRFIDDHLASILDEA
jgi:hypothetical protein